MNANERRQALRSRLASDPALLIPGAYDAISAKLVAEAGFEAVYVGSYSVAASMFGLADVGVVTRNEMVSAARAVASAVDIPVIADAEDGWAYAANAWRTVQEFEDAGAAAIHIEDHSFGKHAPVTPRLHAPEETAARIAAAVAARRDRDFMIIGRTDAPWATGDDEDVVRRLTAYKEAGADVLMPAGVSPEMLARIRDRLPGPVLVTDNPGVSFAQEEQSGANAVLYYGFTLYAAYSGVKSALARLKETGDADSVAGVRDSISGLEGLLGYEAFAARHRQFAGE